MLFRDLNRLIAAMSVILAGTAAGHDFSDADALYLERAAGTTKIQEGLTAYNQAQRDGQLNDLELVYAAEQKSRLYMYWGYIVDQRDVALRVQIADQCKSEIEAIKPTQTFSAVPQYYYWKSACIMAWAKARGVMDSLTSSQLVLDTIEAGRAIDPTYEGGGFDRLSGVLFSKLPPANPFGPNGDLPRSLSHFRRALSSGVFNDPMFPDWKDPDTETGDYFYSTYFYYAEALQASRQPTEARNVAEEALARIADGDLPVGGEAEALVAKANL